MPQDRRPLGQRDIREFTLLFYALFVLGAALFAFGLREHRQVNQTLQASHSLGKGLPSKVAEQLHSEKAFNPAEGKMLLGGFVMLLGSIPGLFCLFSRGKKGVSAAAPGELLAKTRSLKFMIFCWVGAGLALAASIFMVQEFRIENQFLQIAILVSDCVAIGILVFLSIRRPPG